MRTVSAADANRHFSKILRAAAEGETIVVTSHGTPVATIAPVQPMAGGERRRAARLALLERLAADPVEPSGRVTRDDMYE
jgi:prevent-host-death family protein